MASIVEKQVVAVLKLCGGSLLVHCVGILLRLLGIESQGTFNHQKSSVAGKF